MEIKLLSPLWGHEHLPLDVFLEKIRAAGYDGIDTWVPEKKPDRRILFDFLQKHDFHIVTHQHRAHGTTFKKFRSSYIKNLYECAEPRPILINSHTGRDFFSMEQNLKLVDAAEEFTAKTGILVAHETHRGRLGYSPQMTNDFFRARSNFYITADFSHWVCVTESLLDNFTAVVNRAIERSRHIHARVGFEQGPQVSDPRAPEWSSTVTRFLEWWDRIILANQKQGRKIFPITTEFGPMPYMPAIPFTKSPVSDQFNINCFMKDLLIKRYRPSI